MFPSTPHLAFALTVAVTSVVQAQGEPVSAQPASNPSPIGPSSSAPPAWLGPAVPRRDEADWSRSVYFAAFAPYYEGEYRMALEAFQLAARRQEIIGAGWGDNLIACYTMIGECFYHLGDLEHALEQYTAALNLAARGGGLTLFVPLAASPIEPREPVGSNSITWGVRNTPIARPRGSGSVGYTALALRRRREILSSVSPHDPFTKVLTGALDRSALPFRTPEAQVWASCHAGLALALGGRVQQAESELTKSLLLNGQFDHELTPTALLELGKLAFERGQYQAASALFLEATLAGAAFEQVDLVGEAFRGAVLAHLASGAQEPYAPLGLATVWAGKYSRAVQAEMLLLAAEQAAALGQMDAARNLRDEARQAIGDRDMLQGLEPRFHYLSALIDFSRGGLPGGTQNLARALASQKTASLRLFQIAYADSLHTSQSLPPRVCDAMFRAVLREPTAADWSADPLDTLRAGQTPHPVPFEHWFRVALDRKEIENALEISDRIRRHRFHCTLALGGRLLALRWVLEGPEAALSESARLQRQDLLQRYPHYAKLSAQAAELHKALAAMPLVPDGEKAANDQRRLFDELARVSAAQELALRQIALQREFAEFVFPPLRTTEEIQRQMPERQRILSFLVTGQGLTAFALSRKQCTTWTVEEPDEVNRQVRTFLQQLGLAERDRTLSAAVLEDPSWRATGAELLTRLTKPLPPDTWDTCRELVVVPDGILWYVPFEALLVRQGPRTVPLISKLCVRYVPTVALANAPTAGHKPHARTAVIVGKLLAAADPQVAAEAYQQIDNVLPLAHRFDKLPVPSGLFAAACDRLVVLSELAPRAPGPYAWSPTAAESGRAGSTLEDWFALPWPRPAEIVLPGFHTPAESGLRTGGTGNELFLATSGLMACGARSILISRWPLGGSSTSRLLGEYVQELPFTSAAEAWQRSVQLAGAHPVDPDREPRLTKSGWDDGLQADHPLFWAGYLLVDTGSKPKQDGVRP